MARQTVTACIGCGATRVQGASQCLKCSRCDKKYCSVCNPQNRGCLHCGNTGFDWAREVVYP